jgi:hypothetical protein
MVPWQGALSTQNPAKKHFSSGARILTVEEALRKKEERKARNRR